MPEIFCASLLYINLNTHPLADHQQIVYPTVQILTFFSLRYLLQHLTIIALRIILLQSRWGKVYVVRSFHPPPPSPQSCTALLDMCDDWQNKLP